MKVFNKIVGLVTVIAFALSMMVVPAFAAGKAGFPTAGGEKFVVTYYSDSALETPVTTAVAGAKVYAKISANLPAKTLRSFNVDLNVANATIESEETKLALTGFERTTVSGTTLNTIFTSKTGANMYVTLADGSSYDSPTNKNDYLGEYIYTNIGVDEFDITSYKLTVGTEGTVKFTDAETGVGLAIGTIDMDTGEILTVPYTIDDSGLTITSGQTAKKQISYTAAWTDSALKYDSTLEDSALKAAIVANLDVKKVTDGTSAPLDSSKWDVAVDRTAKTATVSINETLASDEELATGASTTLAALNFEFNVIPTVYSVKSISLEKLVGSLDITNETDSILLDYSAYSNEDSLKNIVKIVMSEKANGSTVETGTSVAEKGTDYELEVIKSTTTNTATLKINYLETGKLAALKDTPKEYTIEYKNVTVEWSDITATLTTTAFAENSTADTVKSAVSVTAKKTKGVIVTNNVSLTMDTDYTVAIDGDPSTITADGFVTVTLIGDFAGKTLSPADGKLNFTCTPDVYTYENYTMVFENDNKTFLGTDSDEAIKSKITVKADKLKNGNSDTVKEVIASTNYDISIDRSAKTVTVTFKGDIHGSATALVENITITDVVEYKNISATMTTRMFAAGVSDSDVINAVSVSAEKWINGVKDASWSLTETTDYTIDVDFTGKKVSVVWGSHIGRTTDEFTISVGANAVAVITLGGGSLEGSTYNIRKGTDLTAEISIDGLGASDKIYGVEITFATDKGTVKSASAGTGYGIVSNATYPAANATVKLSKLTNDDATNKIVKFTIDTSALSADDVITLTTSALKLSTVQGGDIAELASFTGESKAATVTELVVPTTADISASFNIKTLGAITDEGALKFESGLTVTKGDTPVTIPAANIEVDKTGNTVKLKNLTVEAGTYKVKIAVPGYTTAEVTITVSYNETTNTMNVTGGTTGAESIYAGDMNGNNAIDADDYATLVAKYGTAAQGDNYKYDLYMADEDGNINLNDIITMVYEYEQYALANITASGIIEQ